MARPKKASTPEYEVKKERARLISSKLILAGQDIGGLPPVKNPARRARADEDFRFFCESYFPSRFALAWSADHLKVIAKIEAAVLRGELYAIAMPRGSGKTTLCQIAVQWAILIGRHSYVKLLGAATDIANSALANIKSDLSTNDLLLEDYPEVCYPLRCLEGEARRCMGQRYYGQLTKITWGADEISMPVIPGSRCSGALIQTAGIQANIRGAVHILPDGRSVRPSLVIIDDPSTDESARSPNQCHVRERILAGAVLGMAGPGKKIAGLMPCTVIRPDDLADHMLDRQRNPDWQGERTKMVYAFPSNEDLWKEYGRVRQDAQRTGGDTSKVSNDFYLKNREEMDKGAVVAWEARFNPDEISAIQHAMNLKLRDPIAFWSEYQNEPMVQTLHSAAAALTREEIWERLSLLERGTLPLWATKLVGFIDVQENMLFWSVMAASEEFKCSVLDYGTYPGQPAGPFTALSAVRTFKTLYAGLDPMRALQKGLAALLTELGTRTWYREDKTQFKIGRLCVDSAYQTSLVQETCRLSPLGSVVLASRGVGIAASRKPFSEYIRHPGERYGLHWRVIPAPSGQRVIHIDTNFWKSFLRDQVRAGTLSFFGDVGRQHELLADHICSEVPIPVTAMGRTVEEWQWRPERSDNHWLDCVVGCLAALSEQQVAIPGAYNGAPKATTVSFAAMRQKAMNKRKQLVA